MVGAPLGTYNGLDLAFKDTNFFFLIGGTFAPLEPDRLRAVYPTREAYVAAVDAAVKDLSRSGISFKTRMPTSKRRGGPRSAGEHPQPWTRGRGRTS